MDISELGALGEFVSSIAVLITLIFLVLQMRQNAKAVVGGTQGVVLATELGLKVCWG